MSILSIIVLYNSNYEKVCRQLNNLINVSTVYMFDNSDSDQLRYKLSDYIDNEKCIYFSQNENMGIAYAQNKGLEYSLDHGFDYVFLIDDDSVIEESALNGLLYEFESCHRQGHKLASLSLQPDEKGGSDYYHEGDLPYVSTANLMSSGSLINAATIKNVGFFDEDLFIDFVDFDWGWRALSQGYILAISKKYKMVHKLGNGRVGFLGLTLGVPSPVRHFYQTRNLFLMAKRKYVPFKWKLMQIMLFPVRFLYFSFCYEKNFNRLNYFMAGLLVFLKTDVDKKGKYKDI